MHHGLSKKETGLSTWSSNKVRHGASCSCMYNSGLDLYSNNSRITIRPLVIELHAVKWASLCAPDDLWHVEQLRILKSNVFCVDFCFRFNLSNLFNCLNKIMRAAVSVPLNVINSTNVSNFKEISQKMIPKRATLHVREWWSNWEFNRARNCTSIVIPHKMCPTSADRWTKRDQGHS